MLLEALWIASYDYKIMTNWREVDYRQGWVSDIFSSLNHGFKSINEKLDTIEWFDGLFAMEQAETIYGIAFVTAQTYITGTISDMYDISEQDSKSLKTEWITFGSPTVVDEITKVSLINTIANYYKHFEEWDGWKKNRQNKNTIETLNKCSITEHTEFPCYETAKIISHTEVIHELNFMNEILFDWRKCLLGHVKNTYPGISQDRTKSTREVKR